MTRPPAADHAAQLDLGASPPTRRYEPRFTGDLFGPLVPMARSLGLVAEEIGDGCVKIRLPYDAAFSNSRGDLHGGAVMTLLDCTLAGTARSHDPVKTAVMTVDVSTHFVAGAKTDVWGIGRLLRRGTSLAFVQAEAIDADGRLIATATGTFKLIRRAGVDDPAE